MNAPHPGAADRNLLFGVLALQLDLVSREALIGAMHAWALEKHRPLGEILVERGGLSAASRALLEPVVEHHIAEHGGDARESLEALSLRASSARQALETIAESVPVEGLSSVDVAESTGEDGPDPTASFLGGATSPEGRFRVLRFLDRGGLGVVSVALDTELDRQVALKEIRARHGDDPASRSRFLREAEVTGKLEHPGIVPVYGLGRSADGRPFYAMRLVRGESLRAAIARFHRPADGPIEPGRRSLQLRELLGRFLDVCDAVAYAHSRGVLHRDLKPANIMLGPFGETLVLDWGLARLIDEESPEAETSKGPLRLSSGSGSGDRTAMGAAVGTPAYMSPEQADGRLDRLGPASDVYGLGATLYCLLTGRPPFEGDSEAILSRVRVGRFDPPRLGGPAVPRARALEAICQKAMALRPEDRYATVVALADDLKRWLGDEPVTAHPDRLPARAGRWARKHRAATLAAAAALLVGTVAIGLAYRREVAYGADLAAINDRLNRRNDQLLAANRREAEANRQLSRVNDDLRRARERADRSRADSDRWLDRAMAAIQEYYNGVSAEVVLGREEFRGLRAKLLARPLAFYEQLTRELADTPADDDRARGLLMTGRCDLARILFMVGRLDEAREQAEAAVRIGEERFAEDAPLAVRAELARSCGVLGLCRHSLGDAEGAASALRRGLAHYEVLVAAAPDDPIYREGIAAARASLSLVGGTAADPDAGLRDAADAFTEAADAADAARAADDADPDTADDGAQARYQRAMGRVLTAETMRKAGALAAAETAAREAIAIGAELVDVHPENLLYAAVFSMARTTLGATLRDMGDLDASAAEYRAARAAAEAIVAAGPDVPMYRHVLAASRVYEAEAERALGDLVAADRAYELAVAEYEALIAGRPDTTLFLDGFADVLRARALARSAALDLPAAIADLSRATAIREQLVAALPGNADASSDLADILNDEANARKAAGELDAAEVLYLRSIAGFETLAAEYPKEPRYRALLGMAVGNLGRDHVALGRPEEALAELRRAVAAERSALDETPGLAIARRFLASDGAELSRLLRTAGHLDEAVAFARERWALWAGDGTEIYNVACEFSLCAAAAGADLAPPLADEAIAALAEAVDAGWSDPSWTLADPDLAPLRDRPDFRRLVASLWDRTFPADPFAAVAAPD